MLAKPKTSAGDSSADNLASGSGQADNHKQKILPFVNDEICSVMLDISFQRMLKKEKVNPGNEYSSGALELWSDDFEGRGDFGQYRSRLVCMCVHACAFFFISRLNSYYYRWHHGRNQPILKVN